MPGKVWSISIEYFNILMGMRLFEGPELPERKEDAKTCCMIVTEGDDCACLAEVIINFYFYTLLLSY